MERLGRPRHGREGRRLSEREVSESNPEELLYVLQRDVSTSLDMTENCRATPSVAVFGRRSACPTISL